MIKEQKRNWKVEEDSALLLYTIIYTEPVFQRGLKKKTGVYFYKTTVDFFQSSILKIKTG